MGTVISELFEESGMTVQDFANRAGLKYGTAYDIAKGVSKVENIGAGAFVRIAHVFGLTADDLIGSSQDLVQDAGSDSILDDEERELINLFRSADEEGRHAITSVARAISKHGN